MASILQSPDVLKDVYEESQDAVGSATKENEKYMESIEGHLSVLKTEWQEFWDSGLSVGAINWFIDLGAKALNFAEILGGLPTVLFTIGSLIASLKFSDKMVSTFNSLKTTFKELKTGTNPVMKAKNMMQGFSADTTSIKSYKEALEGLNSIQAKYVMNSAGLTKEQQKLITSTNELTVGELRNKLGKAGLNGEEQKSLLTKLDLADATDDQVVSQDILTKSNFQQAISEEASKVATTGNVVAKEQEITACFEDATAQTVDTAATNADTGAKVVNTGATFSLATATEWLRTKFELLKITMMGHPILAIATIVTTAISVISLFSSAIETSSEKAEKHAQKVQEVADAYEEAKNKVEDMFDSIEEREDTLDEVTERFSELAQGVDRINGKNLYLNTTEYEEFLDLSSQIIDIFPDISFTLDENGNKIVSLAGDYEQLNEQLAETLRLSKLDDYKQMMADLPDYVNTVADQVELIDEDIENIEKKKGGAQRLKDTLKFDENGLPLIGRNFGKGDEDIMNAVAEIYDQMNIAYAKQFDASRNLFTLVPYSTLTDEERKNFASYVDDYMENLDYQFEQKSKERSNTLSGFLNQAIGITQLDFDEKGTSEEVQKAVMQMLGSYDWSQLPQTVLDGVESFPSYVRDNITSVILDGGEEVQKAFVSWFNNVDFSQSYGTLREQYIAYIEKMQEYLTEEGLATLKLSIGFEQSEDTANRLMTRLQLNGIAPQVAEEFVNGLTVADINTALTPEFDEVVNNLADKTTEGLTQGFKDFAFSASIDTSSVQTILATKAKTKYKPDDSDETTYSDILSEYQDDISKLQEYANKIVSGTFEQTDINSLASEYGIAVENAATDSAELIALIEDRITESSKTVTDILQELIDGSNYDETTKIALQAILGTVSQLSTEALESANSVKSLSSTLLSIPYDQINTKQTVAALDDVSSALSGLDSLYANFKDEDKKMDISGITGLAEEMMNLDEFEEFTRIISNAESSTEDMQGAFDMLATAYVNNCGILEIVNSENKDLIANMLKSSGIANAYAIVEDALAVNMRRVSAEQEYATKTGEDLEGQTWEEIQAFLNEKGALEQVSGALAQLLLDKIEVNATEIDTSSDIDNIIGLANAANASALALSKLGMIKSYLAGEIRPDSMIGLEAQRLLDQLKSGNFDFGIKQEDLIDASVFKTPTTYNGGNSTNGSGSGSGSTITKESFDAAANSIENLSRELSNLQAQLTDTTSWEEQAKIQDKIIEKQKELAEGYEKQAGAYEENYGKKIKGLSKSDIAMIESKDFFEVLNFEYKDKEKDTRYDKLTEAQAAYQQWQEALANYQGASNDYVSEQLNKLQMLSSAYEDQIAMKQTAIDNLNDEISTKQDRNITLTKEEYQKAIDKQKELKSLYEQQYTDIEKEFNTLVESGAVEEGSKVWYEYQQTLNDIDASAKECDNAIYDTTITINSLTFTNWEKLSEDISKTVDSLDSFLDLIKGDGYKVMGKNALTTFISDSIDLTSYLTNLKSEANSTIKTLKAIPKSERGETYAEDLEKAKTDKTNANNLLKKLNKGKKLTAEDLSLIPENILEQAILDEQLTNYEQEMTDAYNTVKELQKKLKSEGATVDENQKKTWEEELDTATKAYYEAALNMISTQNLLSDSIIDTASDGSSISDALDKNQRELDAKQRYIDNLEKTNQKVTASDYMEIIQIGQERINILNERATNIQEELIAEEKANGTSTERYKELLKTLDEVNDEINSITDSIYDQRVAILTLPITNLEETNEELEKAKKAQEDLKDDYDSAISGATTYLDELIKAQEDLKESTEESYDAAIKAIQDQVDALNKENDERQRALDTEEKLYNLRKAQEQRTVRIYREGQGWTYEADQDAIKEAQKAYDDQLLDNRINSLEEQIKALEDSKEAVVKTYDDEVKRLNDIKDKWTEITNAYEKAKDYDMAALLFGETWKSAVASGDVQLLTDVTTDYTEMCKTIDVVTEQIDENADSIQLMNDMLETFDGTIASFITLLQEMGVIANEAEIKTNDTVENISETSTFTTAWSQAKDTFIKILQKLTNKTDIETEKQTQEFAEESEELDPIIEDIVQELLRIVDTNGYITENEKKELDKRLSQLNAYSETYKGIIAQLRLELESLTLPSLGGVAVATAGITSIIPTTEELVNRETEKTVTSSSKSSSKNNTNKKSDSNVVKSVVNAVKNVTKHHDGMEGGFLGESTVTETQDVFEKLCLRRLAPDEIPGIFQVGEAAVNYEQQQNVVKNFANLVAQSKSPIVLPNSATQSSQQSILFSGDIIIEGVQNPNSFGKALKETLSSKVAINLFK